jgi:hypothetical protein
MRCPTSFRKSQREKLFPLYIPFGEREKWGWSLLKLCKHSTNNANCDPQIIFVLSENNAFILG